jgi:hypothetical protein
VTVLFADIKGSMDLARSRFEIEEALRPAHWLTGQLAKGAEIGETD